MPPPVDRTEWPLFAALVSQNRDFGKVREVGGDQRVRMEPVAQELVDRIANPALRREGDDQWVTEDYDEGSLGEQALP